MNKVRILISILLAAFLASSCNKPGTEGDDTPSSKDINISGFAQKGQFIKGSNITAYAVSDAALAPTGESYPTTIKDDLGSFSLSAQIPTSYVELRAEGYYFNENIGRISEGPIYLNAFVSTSQANGAVNVNLLTTLTSGRIKALIKEGKKYSEAKVQAESEVLKAFDLQNTNLEGKSFEDMNITEDGNANAILLAASCLIQQDRSAGEIQKLISDLSSSFEVSGTISEKLYSEITEKSSVSIASVIENLLSFYKDREVSNFEIPAFYGVLNEDYKTGFHNLASSVVNLVPQNYNTEASGATREYLVISYDDFRVEPSAEWIKASVTKICNRLYSILIEIDPNEQQDLRSAVITTVSSKGDILQSEDIRQIGTLVNQRIYIKNLEPVSTRSWIDRDQVIVNGIVYQVVLDPERNVYYVDVPFSPNGYGVSEVAEIMPDSKDVLTPEVFYIPYVDDYYAVLEDTRFKTPFNYGVLKPFMDFPIPNPAEVELKMISAFVELEITDKETGEPVNFKSIKIEANDDVMLSGYIIECLYPEQAMYDPTYIVPETKYREASNMLTVVWVKNGNYVGFQLPPRQTISTLRVTAFSENHLLGNIVYDEVLQNIDMNLQAGHKHKLSLKRPTKSE